MGKNEIEVPRTENEALKEQVNSLRKKLAEVEGNLDLAIAANVEMVARIANYGETVKAKVAEALDKEFSLDLNDIFDNLTAARLRGVRITDIDTLVRTSEQVLKVKGFRLEEIEEVKRRLSLFGLSLRFHIQE